MNKVHLLLGVHAHQPVGNFNAVIAEAHQKCYRPFLVTLARFPTFRFAVHFSGWLLAELERDYPEDMELLREMVQRGQVELVGGGMAEPVLAAIPHRDRCTQLQAMNDHLRRRYGASPMGAWLTERVWEPSIVPALNASGLSYVTVDDYHFLCTGVPVAELDCFYTTEEEGGRLDLFPIAEGLRYRLPFAPAAEAVTHLEALAARGDQAAIYFDDIEKFGIWPDTYEWVYTRGWLVEFIERVLASPAIITSTYAGFRAHHRGRGLVYLPTASYSEMNEWTLPAPAAKRYAGMVKRARDAHQLDDERPFLRGGIWRNFLSRYAEANWMHKRMLDLSSRLATHPALAGRADLRGLLHNAQANDAYWHGLFGGLYLPHLRRAVWRNLLELDSALGAPSEIPEIDFDCDGKTECFLRNERQIAVLRDDGSGGLHEWSSLVLHHNFGDTLRRHEQNYHAAVNSDSQAPSAAASNVEGIASAHDRVSYKHPIEAVTLQPDARGRLLFTESWLSAEGEEHTVSSYVVTRRTPHSLTLVGSLGEAHSTLSKTYSLDLDSLRVSFAAVGTARLCTILHLALPSCDGFGGRYRLADGAIPCGFGQSLELPAITSLWLEDSELGGRIKLETSHPVALHALPFHTVSQSEAGFEQIMQAARLELRWQPAVPLEVVLRIEAA